MASEASSASNLDDAPPPSEIPRQDGSGAHGAGHDPKGHGFLALALGSIGVVFGDIGTSPLYALREALAHSLNVPAVATLEKLGPETFAGRIEATGARLARPKAQLKEAGLALALGMGTCLVVGLGMVPRSYESWPWAWS